MAQAIRCASFALALAGSISTAAAQADRSVEVILDVSSSMAKRLPGGPSKISDAKDAVQRFVRNLPAGTRLALRAYGHQSPDRLRNCRDTELMVDFEPAPQVARTVIRQTERLRPRGYSPISFALRRASRDIRTERSATHMLVLISDGKETCDGDPCATARNLVQRNDRIVIHTIGFSVGAVARKQLACIARVGNGQYYNANNADELARQLDAAYRRLPTEAQRRRVIVIENPEAGKLTVRKPGDKHIIREVESGDVVTAVGETRPTATVPPGIYNVSFGNGLWKSVEVAPGAETVLEPGLLEIRTPSILGHEIIDPDTNTVIDEITPGDRTATLVPDVINVRFGGAVWRDIQIDEGKRTVLTPGIVRINQTRMQGARMREYVIYDETNLRVGTLSLANPEMPLPPGNYAIDVLGRQQPIAVKEGETVVLRVQ
ncbi:MAG: VWA domain-containing protein [Pseudomonadota bacterium]